MNNSSQSLSLHLSISIFMNSYTELEDALQWTYELLVKLDTGPPDETPGKQCVTDRSIAIRNLLELVATDKKLPPSASDDILRECLMAQDFYEHLEARNVNLEETLNAGRRPDVPDSIEIRLQAGKMLWLATKVLSLHALYRSVTKVEKRYTCPFRTISKKECRAAS